MLEDAVPEPTGDGLGCVEGDEVGHELRDLLGRYEDPVPQDWCVLEEEDAAPIAQKREGAPHLLILDESARRIGMQLFPSSKKCYFAYKKCYFAYKRCYFAFKKCYFAFKKSYFAF